MSNSTKITEAELEIMRIIWDNPKTTSTFIIEKLNNKVQWKSTTIKSLINRLLKKEAISFEKSGKEYLYYAVISEEEYIKEESASFLNRVFKGSVSSMLVNFVKSEKLTNEDIEELRNILNNKED